MKYAVLIILLLVVFVAVSQGFGPVEYKTLDNGQLRTLFFTMLSMLFFVSLVIERGLDIFLTIFRAESSEKLDKEIQDVKEKLPSSANPAEDKKELRRLVGQKERHRAKTRNLAFCLAMIIGLLVSLSGIRIFAPFVNIHNPVPEVVAKSAAFQVGLFKFLDVLLTGGILAGGSDGIHKFAETLRAFLETSTSISKAKAKP